MVDLIPEQAMILSLKGLMIFAFLGSLFIFLSPNAYLKVNELLQREYGFNKRFFHWLEGERKDIDSWILRRRGIFGVLFIATPLILLLMIR